MKEKSFRTYISRVLKSTMDGVHINRTTVDAIDSMIRIFAENIVDKSLIITKGDDKITISDKEIRTATNVLFSNSNSSILNSTNMIKFAEDAVAKYTLNTSSSKPEPKELPRSASVGAKSTSHTRESKCNLILSVSACEKYIRKFGQVGYNVTGLSPVFLAGVLENIISSLLSAGAKVTETCGKITITTRHLFTAIENDGLDKFLLDQGIFIIDSSVEAENSLKKKKTSKSKSEALSTFIEQKDGAETKKKSKGRFKPGVKTVMKIRQLQKSNGLLMQHAPFNRIVREIIDRIAESDKKIRVTNDFFTVFQSFIEDKCVKLLESSNAVALHNNRETVYGKDILLVKNLFRYNTSNYTDSKLLELVPEAALRHMSLRAGIKRYGECCSLELRNYIIWQMRYYLFDVVHCALHHKVQTLNVKLLLEGLGMKDVHLSVVGKKRKSTGGNSSSTKSVNDLVEDDRVSAIVSKTQAEEADNEMDTPDLSEE